jgi:hypothetical protein
MTTVAASKTPQPDSRFTVSVVESHSTAADERWAKLVKFLLKLEPKQ